MAHINKGEYTTFVIELEAAVDETLEHIEACINEHKSSFLANNPKTSELEEVPVRNALNALKFLYQEADSVFSKHKDTVSKLFTITYEHLQNAIRLMVFYFENSLFDDIELKKNIMRNLTMYYESRDIADEHLKDKLIYSSK